MIISRDVIIEDNMGLLRSTYVTLDNYDMNKRIINKDTTLD